MRHKHETTNYDYTGSPVFYQAVGGAPVTPSDTDIVNNGILYIGTGGSVAVVTRSGDTLTFTNVANGVFLPVVVKQVLATGTTATDILILY